VDGLTAGRVGLLGGTFDPVHIGHLIAALEARHALALDRVVLLPARTPPHKPDRVPSPVRHRLAMLALALEQEPGLEVGRIDLDRPGPHFTVDTLRIARAAWGMGTADRLWFIMGADSLADLPRWRDPPGILALARLAVVPRPGVQPDLEELERAVPGLGARVDWVAGPAIGVSASDIRAREATGRPVRHQVPAAVEAYMVEHALYRAPAS